MYIRVYYQSTHFLMHKAAQNGFNDHTKMSTPKTVKNNASVMAFINAIPHPTRNKDALTLYHLMNDVTQVLPKMWGTSIVGYDEYHYQYASGRVGDWPMIGFSPRKQNLSIYVMPGFGLVKDLLPLLGKHKTSKACLYINKLEDVDISILRQIIERSLSDMRSRHPASKKI